MSKSWDGIIFHVIHVHDVGDECVDACLAGDPVCFSYKWSIWYGGSDTASPGTALCQHFVITRVDVFHGFHVCFERWRFDMYTARYRSIMVKFPCGTSSMSKCLRTLAPKVMCHTCHYPEGVQQPPHPHPIKKGVGCTNPSGRLWLCFSQVGWSGVKGCDRVSPKVFFVSDWSGRHYVLPFFSYSAHARSGWTCTFMCMWWSLHS